MDTYIPYQLRVTLQQIDPVLDIDWQKQIQQVFAETDRTLHKEIEDQYLKQKNIVWNPNSQSFQFKGHVSLAALNALLRTQNMVQLSNNLQNTLKHLQQYQDVYQIADYLEGVLTQIDNLQVDEHLEIQKEKNALRKAFLYDAATIIKNMEFKVPDSVRHLAPEELRSFILEVYIKQQLLGYWFSIILPREYNQQKLPIFQDYLAAEQKIRDFDVIKTSQFYFLIASNRDKAQNAYSIRRFLAEEHLGTEDNYYLNGVVLDPAELDDEHYIEHFKWQVSRIISIQRQMNPHVVDLMEELHSYNYDKLRPIFQRPLSTAGHPVNLIINERLLEIEQALTHHILEPLQQILKNHTHLADELEYIALNVQRLITEILGFFQDFERDPVVAFNQNAQTLKYRLVAYLKLLQKRQSQIFMLYSDPLMAEEQNQRSQAPIEHIKACINQALDEIRDVHRQIKQKEREMGEISKAGFFKRMFTKPEQLQNEINRLKAITGQIELKSYLEIIKITKQYPTDCVFIESESFISINEKERHYAFPNGENGVTRLPILIQLPEDRNNFSVQEISATLNFDLNQAAQKWLTS